MATIIPSSFSESTARTIREIEKSNDELDRDRERIAVAQQDARQAEEDYTRWQPTHIPRKEK
jgi:hypothetical protein